VRDGDRIEVHVEDSCLRIGCLGDLVYITNGRYARAQVEKLINSLINQVVYHAPQKGPVGAHNQGKIWIDGNGALRCLAIRLEVVRPPQEVVVHARWARHINGHVLRYPATIQSAIPPSAMIAVHERMATVYTRAAPH